MYKFCRSDTGVHYRIRVNSILWTGIIESAFLTALGVFAAELNFTIPYDVIKLSIY